MPTVRERFGAWLDAVESRWSLWALIQASGLVVSFALPAWAVRAAQIFADYAPFSWVVAGFLGVFLAALIRLLWNLAYRVKVNAKYDALFIERGSDFNPLDLTFERKRIYLDNFALPSWTQIEGKTFIECDIIGPACMYFHSSNTASPVRPPKVDAIWLSPSARYSNGFTFKDCIFRNCSFQRITMFASIENYERWKDNPNFNWIGVTPSIADIEERKRVVIEELRLAGIEPPPELEMLGNTLQPAPKADGHDEATKVE